jgi:hypothetical protein
MIPKHIFLSMILFSYSCSSPKGSCKDSYAERWIADYFTSASLVKAERNVHHIVSLQHTTPEYNTFYYSNHPNPPQPTVSTRAFKSQILGGRGMENEYWYEPIGQIDENEEYLLVLGIKPSKEFTAQKTPAQYAEYTEKYQDKGKFKYCVSSFGPISRAYGLERTEGISVLDESTGEDLTASAQIYYKFMDIPKREQLLMCESLPTFNARQLNAVPVFILELAESRKGKKIKVCMRLENRLEPLCVVYE